VWPRDWQRGAEQVSFLSVMNSPTILVTGATGFLGGAVVAELLRTQPHVTLLLLVRAATPGEAEARVRRSVLRFVDPPVLDSSWSRCHVIHGDVNDPAALADPRIDSVAHVLHLAANTSFRSVRGVRHTNILGTLTLAHRMRRVPGLKRFLYVGTALICGADPRPIVSEDDYPRFGVRHLVEYTASKAECEMLLENTAPELPLVIVRPSVVVGHTQLGCLPSASIFWFYRTVDLLRRTTFSLDLLNDVIPVDYAATALMWLLLQPNLRHKRYHLSSGATHSVSWRALAEEFANCYGARMDNPYREVDFPTLVAERGRLEVLLGPGSEDHLLMALELYYRFAQIDAVFDNTRLLEEGMAPPPRFTEYLRLCATLPADRSVYEQMKDDE
jgi:nucleoside-diphosphate-sugar epimerase